MKKKLYTVPSLMIEAPAYVASMMALSMSEYAGDKEQLTKEFVFDNEDDTETTSTWSAW